MAGAWPPQFVDHIDRCPSNDHWNNLRLATPSQNNANQKINSSNTSGFKGVSWNEARRKWQTEHKAERKIKMAWILRSPADAHAAYLAVAREAFGEYHFSGTEILAAA